MAKSDSGKSRRDLIGILNAQGDFWTVLAFENEDAARQHIRHFWGQDTVNTEWCLRKFTFVPVRVRLDQLEPSK